MAGLDLTVGVVSCNRLHYLRALMQSMRAAMPLDRIQCILVDNASVEPGLREYVEGLDFVEHKVFRPERSPTTEAAIALNTILELTAAKQVLLLTDDVQFIVKGTRWFDGVIDLADAHPDLGSIMPIALRQVTLGRYFDGGIAHRLAPNRFPPRRRSRDDRTGVILFPRAEIGMTHSALGVTPIEMWRRIGPFRAGASQTLMDAGGGAEDDMVRRYRASGVRARKALLEVPVLAEIITDPSGTQARIRGNRRFGRYFAPPAGDSYYRVWSEDEAGAIKRKGSATSFEEAVVPLGFELPYDAQGNRLKGTLSPNDSFEWILPSLADPPGHAG